MTSPTVHQTYLAFPRLNAPLANPDGTIAPAWQRLLIGLFQRQGGSSPTNPLAVYIQQEAGGGLPLAAYSSADGTFLGFLTTSNATGGPAQPQTVGSSPYVFTAANDGTLIVSSGKVEISRDGGSIYYTIGLQGGPIPVLISDKVRMTWTGSTPEVTLLPTIYS